MLRAFRVAARPVVPGTVALDLFPAARDGAAGWPVVGPAAPLEAHGYQRGCHPIFYPKNIPE